MAQLLVFNTVSLDGYFTDQNGDMSWAHSSDPEWQEFTEGNAGGGGTLLFGRITYELMASYWPTAAAFKALPVVAKRMNALPKIVFSRTMEKAEWSNTELIKSDPVTAVRRMKEQSTRGMAIMGSGSIVSLLAQAGLIDEYQIVVYPIVLGKGRTMFEGVRDKLSLTLRTSRVFHNGNVFLTYTPTQTR